MWVVEAPVGPVERVLGIGFVRAAVFACVRAERAIAGAEARLTTCDLPVLAAQVDEVYGLVTALSDAIGDLEAGSVHFAEDDDQDERLAARARTLHQRLLAATGALLALTKVGVAVSGQNRASEAVSPC